ncbi:hypothetical protein D043_2833B, partial [Vibrio parahaemolyticus EKP-021]
ANLVPQYAAWSGNVFLPAIELMLIIVPLLRAFIDASTECIPLSKPSTLTSNIRFHSAASCVSI